MDEKNLKSLYDFAVSNKLDIGDYQSFKTGMEKPENRKSFHDFATQNKLDVGGYNEFESNWTLKKKEPTGSGDVTLQPFESQSPSRSSLSGEAVVESPVVPSSTQSPASVVDNPPNIAEIKLQNIEEGTSKPFMDWDKKAAESSFDYILADGLNNSLIGMAYKAKEGRPIMTTDITDYQPSTPEKVASMFTSLVIDLPSFGPGGSIGGGVAKAGVGMLAKSAVKKAVSVAVKEGMTEAAAKEFIKQTAKNIVTHPMSVLSQSAAQGAGALGAYDAARDVLTQIGDGADPNDVDWGQTAKAFGKGSILGGIVGGIGYGTAMASKAATKAFSGLTEKAAKAAINTTGFGVENVAFVTGGAMLEGKKWKDITNEDWIMSFATLGGLKGIHAAGKFIKSNNFTSDKANKGEFKIEFTPEELRSMGEGAETKWIETPETFLKDPQVPQSAKIKIAWATEGIRPSVIPAIDGVVITPVGEKFNVTTNNNKGEVVTSVDYATMEEANSEAIRAYSVIKDAKLNNESAELTLQQKAEVVEQSKSAGIDLNEVNEAKDKEPLERNQNETKAVQEFNKIVTTVKQTPTAAEDKPADVPVEPTPEPVRQAGGEVQNKLDEIGKENPKSIEKLDRIANNGRQSEWAVVTDEKGNIISTQLESDKGIISPNAGVNWEPEKPSIIIHTHPDNSIFSIEDIAMLWRGGTKEIRVVLPNGDVVSAKRIIPEGEIYFDRLKTNKGTIPQIKKIWDDIENEIFDSGKSKDLTTEEIIQKINDEIAPKIGIEITKNQLSDYNEPWVKEIKTTNQSISEAYHKAKADGSNPELVKAVEDAITPPSAVKPSEVKPEIPIENGQEEKGRLQVSEPISEEKVPVEMQAPITETKAESVNPIEVPKEEPSVVAEKPVTPTEGNRGKIIEPHKEVSISQVKAVEDVVSGLNTDMKPMEASMLYSTVKDMDLKSISSENGTEVITIKDKIKEKLFKSLDKKGYVSSFGDGEYSITPKGEQFIECVKKRIETRKGVKDGTDLFPDMAGIPEFKPIYEEIKTQVSDGTIKRITDKDVNELESVTADIERKAESADEAGLVEAIKQADELITEPAISEPAAAKHEPEPVKVPSLDEQMNAIQERFARREITMQEMNKLSEPIRKQMAEERKRIPTPEEVTKKSIKDKADELAARIKKQGYDAVNNMTMVAFLPYQAQIMKGGVWVASEAVRLGGSVAEAVSKGVAEIKRLCKEQNLPQEETSKLISKFNGLPQWKEFDSKKVQKDIEETVGIRNKLKQDYRNLKDKLFQAEQKIKGKTKTEAFEKGAESRSKEVTGLKNNAGSLRSELETIDDVRSQISSTIEDNSDVIKKLTGQKTKTLLRRVNNATSYRDLEKALNYIEKATTDIAFKETANEIAELQKEIGRLIKKNEFSKGTGKGYLGWAKELQAIPKDKFADMPDQMLSDLRTIAEELTRKKVSNVENVQKFFDDYRNEMDKIFSDSGVERMISADSMDGLIGSVEDLIKIDPANISSIDDVIQLKKNLSLVKNKIDRLMAQEDITYSDGKFYDKNGNVIDKYSDLAKNYQDAVYGESVQGLFTKLNEVGIEGMTEKLLQQSEQYFKYISKYQAKDNWKFVDWENFTPEQREVIAWLRKNSNDKSIDNLSLGELDTYVKVVEQLTYGNMPRKLIDIASSIDVLKRASIIDVDFINVIRAAAEKSKYVRDRLLNEENKGELLKDLSRKKDMTDIDEKYGIAGKHSHPVFEIFNNALLTSIEMLNKKRDVLFHTALTSSPFAKTFRSEFKTNKSKELADREVNALRVMMTWQANIPEAKLQSIMQATGLTKEQVLSYWDIAESDWGKRYIADAQNSKGYDAETRKLDRQAYQNLRNRNGGKDIILKLEKTDEEVYKDVSHLLSKNLFQFLRDLQKGYDAQQHEQKVNATKRNIPFTPLRFYDPFFIFDKPVDDAMNAQQFIDSALLDRTAPHTKSGNVNERTFDYHISKMGATDKFRQYTLTNLLNYYMADPLYNTVRALNTLKNKTEVSGVPGEAPKKSLSIPEVQVVSELAEGLRTRFTNVYATKINRGVGNRILIKALTTGAKMGRVSLLDPTRLIKDTAGNQFTALGQLPVSQWKDYADTMLKLDKEENKTLEVLHNESGFREAERYYSEYSDSNNATKKGLYVLSFNDRATQKRIFLNEFNHAFLEFTGKEFDTNKWLTDPEYKSANMDQFAKASAEAKWMAYDTFPSMEKIVKKAQDGGAGDIMINYMQTWQIRESLRFIKQVKNLTLGTNEGRAEATKKIGSFLASQTAFASIGVVQMAGLSYIAAQIVDLWDKETANKLKDNALKGISKLKDPAFWYAIPAASMMQLSLGTWGNINRATQITALSIINSTHPANKKPEWLKDLNNYALAAFYVRPVETNGYTDAAKVFDALLQYTMAAQTMLQTVTAAGGSLYNIGKKVMAGESLSKSEYDAWNAARSVHLVLATMYGYPGAGTVDKLMTRISNAEKTPLKKKRSARVIR